MGTGNNTYTERFTFISSELPADLFKVVRFSGTEGIHSLFNLVIELVSKDNAVDTDTLLHARATFSILRDKADPVIFNGYPSHVEQGGTFNGYTYYTVELCPSFWKLKQLVQSRIFLNANLRDTIKELLISQKFFALGNEFRFTRQDYPTPEFAMQHEESMYDYICWRLEEQGAYYFIAQKPGFDTLVFGDSPQSHTPLEATPTLYYSPATGLEGKHIPEVITSFVLRQKSVPRQVAIRSYDWKRPDKPVVGIAQVSPLGIGDVYLTNEEVTTDDEAQRLATIRAEQILAGQRQYHGQSAAPTLRPGYTFTLSRHYSPPFNRSYLITSVVHEGSQEAFLSLGLGIPMHNVTDHHFYRNSFTCIHDDTVFRPARTAPRNKVSGIIRAFVDGSTSGTRPELDEYGRYKILFPFDISGRKQGNASCWVRMAQQQVGNNSGASFPLLPGTEVTVGFLDGNPNAPIITGALANGETGSLTSGANNEFSGIRTAGGNQITFNDMDTHQGLALTVPSGQGINFSSGSMGTGTSMADFLMSSASTLGTEIAGIGKTVASGFKAVQFAGFPSYWAMATLATKAVSNLAGSVSSSLTSLSNKSHPIWKGSADGVKLASLLASLLLNTKSVGSFVEPGYGAILNATSKASLMKLEVLPTKTEAVTAVILALLGRGTSLTLNAETELIKNGSNAVGTSYLETLNKARQALYAYDKITYANYGTNLAGDAAESCSEARIVITQMDEAIAMLASNPQQQVQRNTFKKLRTDLESAWNSFCNNADDNENYYVNVHKRARHNAAVSAISNLLPELLSYIVLTYASLRYGRNKKRLGGISISSPDSNINIKAKLPVSVCSDSGILVNTRTRLPAENPAVADGVSAAPDSTAVRVAGKVKSFGDWGRPGKRHLKEPVPDTEIDKLYAEWKDFLLLNGLTFTNGNQTVTGPDPGSAPSQSFKDFLERTSFIANVTDLAYTEGKYGVDIFGQEHYSSAQKQTISAENASLTLSCATDSSNQVTGGATLEVGNLNAGTDNRQLVLKFGGDPNDFSRLVLNKTVASMSFKPDDNDNKAQLSLAEHHGMFSAGTQKGVVTVSDASASMGFNNTASVVCSDNQVAITGNTVTIGDLTIAGDKIKGSDTGIIDFADGAVKITSGAVRVDVKEQEKKIRDNQQDLQEKLDKADRAIQKLTEMVSSLQADLEKTRESLAEKTKGTA